MSHRRDPPPQSVRFVRTHRIPEPRATQFTGAIYRDQGMLHPTPPVPRLTDYFVKRVRFSPHSRFSDALFPHTYTYALVLQHICQ